MKQTQVKYDTPPQPRQIRLDTTTVCNAECYSCHRYYTKRQGEMPFKLIEQIVEDVSHWNPPLEEIIPVNYGEFFLRKDWFDILNLISESLPRTQIVTPTNGVALTTEKILELVTIPNVKVINFSINAFFDDTYENFTGITANQLHKIPEKIQLIKTERPDMDIRISMVFDPIYQTDLERDYFKSYWSQLGSVWILPAASNGRNGKQPINPVIVPCRSLFSDFVIGYDGKLSSCCFDAGFNLDLGYYSGDLKKDWMSKEFIELRKIHNNHQRETIPMCRECTFG